MRTEAYRSRSRALRNSISETRSSPGPLQLADDLPQGCFGELVLIPTNQMALEVTEVPEKALKRSFRSVAALRLSSGT